MIMKSVPFFVLLAFLAGGCVDSHRARVYYTPPPSVTPPPVVSTAPPVYPPTSDRPETRSYSTTPSGPAPNVAPGDVAIAESVSQVLKGDSRMATASQEVLVKVRNGIVSLRGSVPSDQDRAEIVERVSLVPGVREVRNELGVEQP